MEDRDDRIREFLRTRKPGEPVPEEFIERTEFGKRYPTGLNGDQIVWFTQD